jgi:micrococcal nuclease
MKTKKSPIRPLLNLILLLGGVSAILTACRSTTTAAPANAVTVDVQRVIDGQTIEWVDRSQQPPLLQQGKLIAIEVPHLKQAPWGKAAKQRLEEILRERGDSIEIVAEETPDRFGRKSIRLWNRGTSIDELLIREGHALPNYRATEGRYLDRAISASQYARLMGEGIWSQDNPLRLPPSEFRREM